MHGKCELALLFHSFDKLKNDGPLIFVFTYINEESLEDCISPSGKPEHKMSQAIAQNIVFSLLQKQRHSEFANHMVPNNVISPNKG